ncbi:MAG TPA: bifunctional demethylmenaquinone methyltransferase/2-methoxy-6-polyprenyl-1,4-benzoquinol methylase UbiE [Opitutaceae bacterium]|nr:bifunctional demethylmenaquinone methyltransferase/2-methoxy-6-polyprenyl-1,4-benzoquinol methylase UbiE [Opitutaceae bacterium]
MPDPIAVNSMFARIARRYDVANRLLSGGMDVWWRRRLVSAVKAGEPRAILDLATGSGDVAFALAGKLGESVEILGMDFCQPMLDEAEIKKTERGGLPHVHFQQGDGLALPIEDNSFDAVTISFGLRNMSDRARALSEMMRVLRPGGSLFVLEFSQPYRWFRPFYFFYLRRILPFIAGRITGDRAAYEYLNNTIEQFPGRKAMAEEIRAVGFKNITARPMTFGIVALHKGTKEEGGRKTEG